MKDESIAACCSRFLLGFEPAWGVIASLIFVDIDWINA
jgi:hypothetical protein